MQCNINGLEFMVGVWQGDGFLWDFRPPLGGMMFGHMQAIEGDRCVYWETLRFAEEAAGLAAYPTAMDKVGGRFAGVPTPPGNAVFKGPETSPFDTIGFHDLDGTLVARVVGMKDGKPYDESWPMVRVEA